jgi:DNA end-binding protein Ku
MGARAIWQGTVIVQKHKLDVKFYSAVVDRQTHFHLLHKRDRTRVEQRMVDSQTDQPVLPEETRKAFEIKPGVFILVTPEEMERSEPKLAREVRLSRCVPRETIEPQLFDRPYYLGPGADSSTDYFALAQALQKKNVAGIASWVMRKRSYVGALISEQGYLMMITLRHAEEVIPLDQLEPPQGGALEPKEKDLAGKLIEALSGEFDPEAYHDHYQERIRELIDAKRTGKKLKPKPVPRRHSEGTLAESLRSSLKSVSARRRT